MTRRRTREREKSNCRSLFSLVCFNLLCLLAPSTNKKRSQEESRRAEKESRAMSERTIDAQRASAPVPR